MAAGHASSEPDKDKLYRDGQELCSLDEKNVTVIQNILASIDINWAKVGKSIQENKLRLGEMNAAYRKFTENNNQALGFITKAEECGPFEIPTDLTSSIMRHENSKKAVVLMKQARSNIDSMENKYEAIVKQGQPLSNFSVKDLKEILDTVQVMWNNNNEKYLHLVESTESQMVIWKQIDEAKNSLMEWLESTNAALSGALENIGDTEEGLSKLRNYKNELPSHLQMRKGILDHTKQLYKLNEVDSIPTLDSLKNLLNDEFNELERMANELESITSSLCNSEQQIRDQVKVANDAISSIREELMACDSLSGENQIIINRLKRCKQLRKQLDDQNIDAIEASFAELAQQFPSLLESSVFKELNGLKKRFSEISLLGNKVETTLLGFLFKCYKEKKASFNRNIVTFKEKTAWCLPEPDSDRYSLEAKMVTLKEIEPGINSCLDLKTDVENSLKLLVDTGCDIDTASLINEQETVFKDHKQLVGEFEKCKGDLQDAIHLWQQFETVSDSLLGWLKEMETKVREATSKQIELPNLSSKINTLEGFQKEVSSMSPKLNDLKSVGGSILDRIPESRVSNNTEQILNRFKAVQNNVNNFIDRLSQLRHDEVIFRESVAKAQQWIIDTGNKLGEYEHIVKSTKKPSTYQEVLEKLKTFTADKEVGLQLINKAIEEGEVLFPNISPENRDLIRSQLRSLRDDSEALIDRASSIGKAIESVLMQRNSFDVSHQQISQWIEETEKKLKENIELKKTLQEKKLALHFYRSLVQDITSHQSIFHKLQEKFESIPDVETGDKLNKIMEDYNTLLENAKSSVSVYERHVENHEAYVQALEKSRDFMRTLVSEEAVSDRDGDEAKLTIIENILLHKEDGDKLLSVCNELVQTVLAETDKAGHEAIITELDEHKRAWLEFISRCNANLNSLKQLCRRWGQLEEKIEELTAWLKAKESQVKDQSLKSTEEAKKIHLEKLKVLVEEIVSRSDDFSSLVGDSVEADAEITERVSKTSMRYQTLKTQAKVSAQ